MNLRTIDLNLLVIFDAIATERSIGRAAEKVGLSQSAMSHALRRLRRTFNDDLIRRTSEGMELTPRSLALAETVRGALAMIEQAVDAEVHFDPKTSQRRFNIRVSDYIAVRLLSGMCARARLEAPGVTLMVSQPASMEVMDADTDAYLGVCHEALPAPGYQLERLYQSPYIIVLRRGHPAAGKKMTLDLMMKLSYLRVTPSATSSTAIDSALARRGLTRNIVITLPSLSGVLPIILQTDLSVILPEAWLALHGSPYDIVTSPLPVPDVAFTVDILSSVSGNRDPGLRWLVRLVKDEFQLLKPLLSASKVRPREPALIYSSG
jgi:DNA-binding transcriptional LysR family regulator